MITLSASILAADFACLGAQGRAALQAGADWLHIDVMDGHFVPNISFGAPVLSGLHKAVPNAFYDVHLMITDPLRYLPDFVRAGANLVTFHLEAVPGTAHEVIRAIHAAGCKAGVSIRPGTPVETLAPYLQEVELVLLMSVEPGFGGQCFLAQTPARLQAVKKACLACGAAPYLEVDGGVNAQTAPLCTAAGADVLVMGSAFFGAGDPAALARTVKAESTATA